MQLISWTVARLGSRFSLFLEPHQRQVRHSALGRFLDKPLDLSVGLIEPDGTERVLPFTKQGELLHNPEQFERFNSITYRAYSEKYKLRFEFNIHSLFYPQNEQLCLLPAFYLEMRVNPITSMRWVDSPHPTPRDVRLFLRVNRPDTEITVGQHALKQSCINMAYTASLAPHEEGPQGFMKLKHQDKRTANVRERIVSLNMAAAAEPDKNGLSIELPVTETGSGIKWRLVWGAYTPDPILQFNREGQTTSAPFKYTQYWDNLDEVLTHAINHRDDDLALSRRLEKAIDQSPLRQAQRHLLNQGFQSYLANTFWCNIQNPVADLPEDWFTVWEGSCYYNSTLDVEYNVAPFYLALWPELLAKELKQWPMFHKVHKPSNGIYLHHDAGQGAIIAGQAFPYDMPIEENCNYLLLLQSYTHVTGLTELANMQADHVEQMVNYLLWTDLDDSGFPSIGGANTITDGEPAVTLARKQTYLAVKRLAALRAASDMLATAGRVDRASELQKKVETIATQIESQAWLGDHYAVCVDTSTAGLVDVMTSQPLPLEQIPGWDGYSIFTGNGLLLPMICGQSTMLDQKHLVIDILNASRETLGPYGCSHTSSDGDNVWISQNIWRDHLARYLGMSKPMFSQIYWDLQTMSNTGQMSLGYVDTYIGNNLSAYPRGAASLGIFFAGPRLSIDRLTSGTAYIAIDPDLQFPQRWPLMALADWKAGKIPVCVVNNHSQVSIENEIDPITILGQ